MVKWLAFIKHRYFISSAIAVFLHNLYAMFEILFENISRKIALEKHEQELLTTFFIPKKLRKKQYLLQEGDVSRYLAFVEKGILRSYTIDDKGGDHIAEFAFEGWWIGDQFSFLSGEPSAFNIDALEDCELLLLTRQAEEQMLEKIPKMERFFRLLLQNHLIATQSRLVSSLSNSAEQKYTQLVAACPTIPQRVPQHMLASYLGITPETLSRLRRQLARRT